MGLFGGLTGGGLSGMIQKINDAGKSAAGAVSGVASKAKDAVTGAAGKLPGMVHGFENKLPGMSQINALKDKLPGADMMHSVESGQPQDFGGDALTKLNHIAALHQAASMTPEGDQDLTPGAAPRVQDPTRPRIPNPFR